MIKVECKEFDHVSREEPSAYDSQSNGAVEAGVKVVRGILRTLKLCTENCVSKYIPVSQPIMAWMLEHSCLLINVLVRGSDGLTA